MKRNFISAAFAALVCLSCGVSMEEKAHDLVSQAGVAYEAKDYNKAKLLLDSVKTAYPKAFKARREALRLMRNVELGEQQRSVDFLDRELALLTQRRDSMLGGFVLEKDKRYQDVGNYIVPSQTIKNNIGNTYLRAQVDENGNALLTSVYRGRALSHDCVRVSAGDVYAECNTPFNKYSSKHLGVTTERVDFRYMQDGGLMQFIATADMPITVVLSGKTKHKYRLRSEDARAIADVLELTTVLQAIDSLKSLRDEAGRHIEFLMRSKERFENDSIGSAE